MPYGIQCQACFITGQSFVSKAGWYPRIQGNKRFLSSVPVPAPVRWKADMCDCQADIARGLDCAMGFDRCKGNGAYVRERCLPSWTSKGCCCPVAGYREVFSPSANVALAWMF